MLTLLSIRYTNGVKRGMDICYKLLIGCRLRDEWHESTEHQECVVAVNRHDLVT